MLESCDGLFLRGFRSCHVENLLFHNRAMQVIDAIGQRYLGEWQSHADPVGGEMLNIIEKDPTNGEITQLLDRGGRFDVRKNGRLRLECKRNKTSESASFVLQFAKLAQVIDSLFECLDMSIKHGASAATAHLVPDPMNVEPLLRAFFAAANLIPYLRVKDFGAAPGKGAEPGITQK